MIKPSIDEYQPYIRLQGDITPTHYITEDGHLGSLEGDNIQFMDMSEVTTSDMNLVESNYYSRSKLAIAAWIRGEMRLAGRSESELPCMYCIWESLATQPVVWIYCDGEAHNENNCDWGNK